MGWQAGELYHGLPRPSTQNSEQRSVEKFRLDRTDELEATGKSSPEAGARLVENVCVDLDSAADV
jgi:hypothetical protein